MKKNGIVYNLYYDESFHDRNIKFNNKTLNIYKENQSVNFISSIIGFKEDELEKYEKKYTKFEKKYKKIFTINQDKELKETIIKKKNYKYGFASMNSNSLNFYIDFFNLIEDDTIIQITFINKIFFIITKILRIKNISVVDLSEFYYSISKFIDVYRPKCILEKLFDNKSTTEDTIRTIVEFMNTVLENNKNISFKTNENDMLFIMISLFLNAPESFVFKQKSEYKWEYNYNIEAIQNLVKELKINRHLINLFIDEEYGTYEEAKKNEFNNVFNVNSNKFFGVRMSDLLCDFFSRMVRSIDDELYFCWDDKDSRKKINQRKLLSREWFDLNEKSFDLCKKVGKILKERKSVYWGTYSSFYSGTIVNLFSLVNYLNSFSSYKAYKMSNNNHIEMVNYLSLLKESEKFQ